MTSSLLDIRSLPFSVGDRKILDRLDLAIHPREIHALRGANGFGKTTLAYILTECDGNEQAGGTVLFKGADLLALKMHERAKLGLTLPGKNRLDSKASRSANI